MKIVAKQPASTSILSIAPSISIFLTIHVLHTYLYVQQQRLCEIKSHVLLFFRFSFFSITHSALFSPNRPKKKNEKNVQCKNHIKTTCYMFVCGFFLQPFVSRMIFLFSISLGFYFGLLIVPSLFFFIYIFFFCDIVAFTYYGFMRIIRTIRGAKQKYFNRLERI